MPMPAVGGINLGQQNTPQQNPLSGIYGIYGGAVKQNAEDYSGIMQGYRDLLTKAQSLPQTYSPQTYQYSPTSEYQSAIGNLKNLSQTGGYSAQDINSLRERGISPIRSIYANAQRNLDRQRSLQGGFSPNYAAATAKMSRQLADEIGNQVNTVNAGLAQNVAQNKLQIAPTYANTAGQESALRNQYGMENTGIVNDANKFNISNILNSQNLQGDALRGMTSLYGTTPALSSLFGSQAMSASDLVNRINQQGSQNGLNIIAQLMRG